MSMHTHSIKDLEILRHFIKKATEEYLEKNKIKKIPREQFGMDALNYRKTFIINPVKMENYNENS